MGWFRSKGSEMSEWSDIDQQIYKKVKRELEGFVDDRSFLKSYEHLEQLVRQIVYRYVQEIVRQINVNTDFIEDLKEEIKILKNEQEINNDKI